MSEMPHVLVIDDDVKLRKLLARYLGDNGFAVATAVDAEDARAKMAAVAFDLLIVDVMMPGESGLDLASDIRRRNPVPILLLTAMSEASDRIAGLESGADDYLVKPFEPRELLLRIGNILKRVPPAESASETLRFGPLAFSLSREELLSPDGVVRLTSVEAALLKALARRPGIAVSREELIDLTGAAGGDRAIDVQVTRLRRKLEPDAREPRYIRTVRGKGYMLMPD